MRVSRLSCLQWITCRTAPSVPFAAVAARVAALRCGSAPDRNGSRVVGQGLACRLRLERREIGLAAQPHDAHLVGAIDRQDHLGRAVALVE